MEKLFPLSVNPNFCILCQKCSYSCPTKAIFFRNSSRYVDYNKCKGCLKCVDVCEHNAIEVISMEEGELVDFKINNERCNVCKKCLENDFCFQNLFNLSVDSNTGKKYIIFVKKDMNVCFKCLKCFKDCPNNAIIPIISSMGSN
jgi:NAD-dependent dihydropyrimidine dehydrogenase PreA subunit